MNTHQEEYTYDEAADAAVGEVAKGWIRNQLRESEDPAKWAAQQIATELRIANEKDKDAPCSATAHRMSAYVIAKLLNEHL